MIWGRRDHRAYGTAILITGIAWFLPTRTAFYKLRRPATQAAMAAGAIALRSRPGEHEDDGSEQAS